MNRRSLLGEMHEAVQRFDPIKLAMRAAVRDNERGERLLQEALVSGAFANEVRLVLYFGRIGGAPMRTELL